jgi:hypothetical protein
MTQELLVDYRDQAEGVSATDDRLDVLACSGHRCIVVMPGYGLLWIETDALKSWERPLHRRHVPIPPPPLAMRTIVTSENANASVVVNTGSCGLALSSEASEFKLLQAKIPSLCSSLRSLILPGCEIQSLDELLTGPTNGQFTIESLAVGKLWSPKVVASPSPCFDAITQPTSPIRHVLRELSVESLRLSNECLASFAVALETNRRLEFLQLRCSARKGNREGLASKFRIPLGPTTNSKLSIYAFLLSMRRSSRWNWLPFECKRLVVEYAVIQARRQVALIE